MIIYPLGPERRGSRTQFRSLSFVLFQQRNCLIFYGLFSNNEYRGLIIFRLGSQRCHSLPAVIQTKKKSNQINTKNDLHSVRFEKNKS